MEIIVHIFIIILSSQKEGHFAWVGRKNESKKSFVVIITNLL